MEREGRDLKSYYIGVNKRGHRCELHNAPSGHRVGRLGLAGSHRESRVTDALTPTTGLGTLFSWLKHRLTLNTIIDCGAPTKALAQSNIYYMGMRKSGTIEYGISGRWSKGQTLRLKEGVAEYGPMENRVRWSQSCLDGITRKSFEITTLGDNRTVTYSVKPFRVHLRWTSSHQDGDRDFESDTIKTGNS